MTIFTEDLKNNLERKRQHGSIAREHYDLVFDKSYESVRTWIDWLSESLDEVTISALSSKFKNCKLIDDTITELIVAKFLSTAGFTLSHEAPYYVTNGAGRTQIFTPDFSLSAVGQLVAIAEVFTKNAPNPQEERSELIQYLISCIEGIPIPLTLFVNVADWLGVDKESCRRAALEIQKNLIAGSQSLTVDGLEICVIQKNFKFQHCLVCSFDMMVSIDPLSFRRRILDKLTKYESLLSNHNLPYIVFVGASSSSHLMADGLADLLYGPEVFDFDVKGNPVNSYRGAGLFSVGLPWVSSVYFVRVETDESISLVAYDNPSAIHRSPISANRINYPAGAWKGKELDKLLAAFQ